MPDPTAELILHHYDASPYSEKVRLVLGMKELSWRSVQIPSVMPKPDLMPLTGGYRRTPVMQVGADVYCDTACIIRELERRYPEPGLFPHGETGLAWMVAAWSDRAFFQASVGLIFGTLADAVPEAFIRDREQLSGQSFDPQAMKAALPAVRAQWRAHLDLIETQLADGRAYLLGERPGLADVHAYMNVWFARAAGRAFRPPDADSGFRFPGAEILDRFPRVIDWADRVSLIGHGHRHDMEAADALRVAADARPATGEGRDAGEPDGLAPGDAVSVVPDDYGRDPVRGELVTSGPQEVVVRREDERVGEVAVHFPRAGFVVARDS